MDIKNVDIRELAKLISHGTSDAETLVSDLKEIQRDYSKIWLQTSDEMIGEKSVSKETIRLQLITLDWLIDFFEKDTDNQ